MVVSSMVFAGCVKWLTVSSVKMSIGIFMILRHGIIMDASGLCSKSCGSSYHLKMRCIEF